MNSPLYVDLPSGRAECRVDMDAQTVLNHGLALYTAAFGSGTAGLCLVPGASELSPTADTLSASEESQSAMTDCYTRDVSVKIPKRFGTDCLFTLYAHGRQSGKKYILWSGFSRSISFRVCQPELTGQTEYFEEFTFSIIDTGTTLPLLTGEQVICPEFSAEPVAYGSDGTVNRDGRSAGGQCPLAVMQQVRLRLAFDWDSAAFVTDIVTTGSDQPFEDMVAEALGMPVDGAIMHRDFCVYTVSADGTPDTVVASYTSSFVFGRSQSLSCSWRINDLSWEKIASPAVCAKAVYYISGDETGNTYDIMALKSDTMWLSPAVLSRALTGGEQINLDLIDMKSYDIHCINKKIETDKIKVIKQTSSLLKPVYFSVKDLESMTLHPGVKENVGLNLAVFTGVSSFILQFGTDASFPQTGGTSTYTIFQIDTTKLKSQSGSYSVTDKDGIYLAGGKYTIDK